MLKEKSCGVIIIQNKKILLIQQRQGFYGFPKGHIKKNETEEETALRECKEETNLDVKIIPGYRYTIQYMINNEISKEVIYFLAKPLNNQIKRQESEILDIEWIDIDKVYDKLTFQNIKDMWIDVQKDISNIKNNL